MIGLLGVVRLVAVKTLKLGNVEHDLYLDE